MKCTPLNRRGSSPWSRHSCAGSGSSCGTLSRPSPPAECVRLEPKRLASRCHSTPIRALSGRGEVGSPDVGLGCTPSARRRIRQPLASNRGWPGDAVARLAGPTSRATAPQCDPKRRGHPDWNGCPDSQHFSRSARPGARRGCLVRSCPALSALSGVTRVDADARRTGPHVLSGQCCGDPSRQEVLALGSVTDAGRQGHRRTPAARRRRATSGWCAGWPWSGCGRPDRHRS